MDDYKLFQSFYDVWCGSYECTTCNLIAERMGIDIHTQYHEVEHINLDDIWIDTIGYINRL